MFLVKGDSGVRVDELLAERFDPCGQLVKFSLCFPECWISGRRRGERRDWGRAGALAGAVNGRDSGDMIWRVDAAVPAASSAAARANSDQRERPDDDKPMPHCRLPCR